MDKACSAVSFIVEGVTYCIHNFRLTCKESLELIFGFVVVAGIAALIILLIAFLSKKLASNGRDYYIGYSRGMEDGKKRSSLPEDLCNKSADYIKGYITGCEKHSKAMDGVENNPS